MLNTGMICKTSSVCAVTFINKYIGLSQYMYFYQQGLAQFASVFSLNTASLDLVMCMEIACDLSSNKELNIMLQYHYARALHHALNGYTQNYKNLSSVSAIPYSSTRQEFKSIRKYSRSF